MKRVIVAASLIVLILAGSVWGLILLKGYAVEITQQIDGVLEAVKADDHNDYVAKSILLNRRWLEIEGTLVRYIRHNQIDDITGVMARIVYLAQYDDQSELTAELHRAKVMIQEVWYSETPRLKNIF